MECCICKKKLKSFEDCPELWYEGSKVIICLDPECKKKYMQQLRDNYNKKHNVNVKKV